MLTTVLKNGCLRASLAVILLLGSTTRHRLIKSFGSSKYINCLEKIQNSYCCMKKLNNNYYQYYENIIFFEFILFLH